MRFIALAEVDQNAELVTAEPCNHVIVAADGVLDARGYGLEQFIPGVMPQAVIDAFEVVNVEEHHGEPGVPGGAVDEFFSKQLIETTTVDQVGQRVEMRHLLQGRASLVELTEQGVDAPQIVLLELQLLVDNRGADATANQQQGDDAYHKGQLPVVAGCIRTARQCVANDEVSAEQAACSKHAQGIFIKLMEQAAGGAPGGGAVERLHNDQGNQ